MKKKNLDKINKSMAYRAGDNQFALKVTNRSKGANT